MESGFFHISRRRCANNVHHRPRRYGPLNPFQPDTSQQQGTNKDSAFFPLHLQPFNLRVQQTTGTQLDALRLLDRVSQHCHSASISALLLHLHTFQTLEVETHSLVVLSSQGLALGFIRLSCRPFSFYYSFSTLSPFT
jgi:hypothetical protein